MIVALLVAESVVLALLTLIVAGLLRSHGEILRRLHVLGAGLDDQPPAPRLPAGTPAAPVRDLEGHGLHDDALTIAVGGVPHRTLLAFLSSGCATCRDFWHSFDDVDSLALPRDVRPVIVVKDASDESITALRDLAPRDVPVVMASTAWAAYDVPGSPYFVLVDGPSARIAGEGTGATWAHVRRLMEQASGDAREAEIDRALLAHGIGPADPSLYATAEQIASAAGAGS